MNIIFRKNIDNNALDIFNILTNIVQILREHIYRNNIESNSVNIEACVNIMLTISKYSEICTAFWTMLYKYSVSIIVRNNIDTNSVLCKL